ncbi:MAG TPA: hypothetical protein VGL84_07110 [Gaiellaceae bacterium]|jgi:hypothetical protein
MFGRALGVVTTLAGVSMVAGCGGSSAPSVARLATTTSSAARTAGTRPSTSALATCFRSHGFPASIGSGNGGNANITFGGVSIGGNVDPNSLQFQAAMQACRKYLPGGGPPALTPAQRATAVKAMASFASCMRKEGAPNFPDPNSDGTFPASSVKQVGIGTPRFQTAFKTCEPLEPKVGPRIVFGAGNVEQHLG